MSGSGSRPAVVVVACLLALLAPRAGLDAQQPAQNQQPAAQAAVRGTVVDDQSNEPVSGVAVTVRGTPTTGTTTNEQGQFTLPVRDPNATLNLARIGFARDSVALAGRSTVNVRLRRVAVTLNTQVVVGYGTQRRSDVTGSVASVSAERLQEKPNTSVVQGLEGAIPGVAITTTGAGADQRSNIQIRGRNSISASTEPLVVVDGIPYNGSLSEINPTDIASVEVLKDASATAIYGSRGSNGVLLVTTKRGGTGTPRVAYNGYAGTQRFTNLPALMNAQQFADFKCVRIRQGQNCDTALTATERTNLAAGVNTNWLEEATRTGTQQQHDLSVNGGTDDTKYFLGGSLLRVNGVARNDLLDRVTVRANLDQRLASWLRLGSNTQVARTDRGGQPPNFTNAFFTNPLLNARDSTGAIIPTPWPEDAVTNNPLEGLLAVSEDNSRRLFSSNYLQADVPRVRGLSLRVNAGVDIADGDEALYYGRNTQTGLEAQGRATVVNTRRSDWTVENILRYTRGFGAHNVDFTGLYSRQSNSYDFSGSQERGFPNDVLSYRSTVPLQVTPLDTLRESDLVSQMGRLNYSYDERYVATATVRRDGYSGFGRNDKYGVFPSAALAWNASNERFFPWKNAVSELKLRLTYGQSGNQAIRPYQTLSQLDDRSYLAGDAAAAGYIPVTLGNPNLRWETTAALNAGIDLGLWNNRVRVTADAYSARTRDLLLRRAISSVHGIGTITQNIGRTANRGAELRLETVNLDRGAFTWRTDFNISANRNKIVDLYGSGVDDVASGWFIGEPVDVNYGYQFGGVWQPTDDIANSAQPAAKPGDVRVRDVNGDGKIDPLDRTIIGSREPSYIAGLSNTLRYQRFTASAFLQTVQGVTRVNDLLNTDQTFTDVRRNMVERTWWTPENPINTYPANSNTSNLLLVQFYEDASYVRLRDVSLSYDLPAALTSRLGSESLRLYVNGRNLWTSTEWSGLDPAVIYSGAGGIETQRGIPLERTIIGGINVAF